MPSNAFKTLCGQINAPMACPKRRSLEHDDINASSSGIHVRSPKLCTQASLPLRAFYTSLPLPLPLVPTPTPAPSASLPPALVVLLIGSAPVTPP